MIRSHRARPGYAGIRRPRAKTIASAPTRSKLCLRCLTPKLVTEFPADTDGYPGHQCKACRRTWKRERYRQRYHSDPAFREREKAKARSAYARKIGRPAA